MKTTAQLAYELIMEAPPGMRAKTLRDELIRRQVIEGLRAEVERRAKRETEASREVITHRHLNIRTG